MSTVLVLGSNRPALAIVIRRQCAPINEQINTSAGKNITYLINLYRNRTTDELKTAAYKYVGPLEEEIGAVTTQYEAYAY